VSRYENDHATALTMIRTQEVLKGVQIEALVSGIATDSIENKILRSNDRS